MHECQHEPEIGKPPRISIELLRLFERTQYHGLLTLYRDEIRFRMVHRLAGDELPFSAAYLKKKLAPFPVRAEIVHRRIMLVCCSISSAAFRAAALSFTQTLRSAPAVSRLRLFYHICTAFLQPLVKIFCFSLSHMKILSSTITAMNAANTSDAARSRFSSFMPFILVRCILPP